MKLELSRQIPKNIQISHFINTRSVRAELFHADRRKNRQADRQTDMTKIIARF
jgi:hypothetical protein